MANRAELQQALQDAAAKLAENASRSGNADAARAFAEGATKLTEAASVAAQLPDPD